MRHFLWPSSSRANKESADDILIEFGRHKDRPWEGEIIGQSRAKAT